MQSNPTTFKEFSSYLRSQSLQLDILCLQEVSHFRSQSTLTESQVRSFSFAFPNCSLIVSKHCAIVCLNSRYSLVDTEVLLDERCLVASVIDASSNVVCKVANIYGPAQSSDRPSFLSQFLSLSLWSDVLNTPWMLMGDFNIHLHSLSVSRQADVAPFVHWLRTHFVNCHPEGLATFPRSNTCIDYLFGHSSLASRLTNSQLLYMPSRWTDHSLLTVEMLPATASIGPGSWRFNPTLLEDKEFVALLKATVSLFFSGAVGSGSRGRGSRGTNTSQGGSGDPESTVARWESFKLLLKCCAQRYTRSMKARFKNKVFTLQLERMKALSTSVSSIETRNTFDQTDRVAPASGDTEQVRQLEVLIENQIQKETRQNMLRSATRWLEQGECSNKYFYRSIKVRESQQTIQSLKCSTTGDILVDAAAINREAQGFYQRLYTPDAVDAEAIDTLLGNVPSDVRLSSLDSDMLMALPTRDTLVSLLTHAPKSKSPGLDGLPFELYQYLAGVSTAFLDLLVDVLSVAFSGVFPPSWQQTRMVLLFKKGDPQLLVNWRPLSLINSDAKLFTKLIANRMNKVLPKLINPYQTGFLPHRLISDNGWLNQLLMSHLRVTAPDLPQVAVLLDQEKAYDRVHPEYLRRVLLRFGFPAGLVSCLSSLFFGTKISVSINGWLGAPVPQLRGLRQGDPLSPLLFNLAFEPLLRSLLACPGLSGVTMSPVDIPRKWKPSPVEVREDHGTGARNWTLDFVSGGSAPAPMKLLSYADDLEVFLSSPEEWSVLLSVLDLYGLASNAKVNISKTVLVSLSGVAHPAWVALADSAGLQWHDVHSRSAVRYLGYPLYHTESQLQDYLDGVLVKVRRHSNLLKQRNLSIRGAGLVANSLLLSKVYHLLRVVPGGGATESWVKALKKVVREFLVSFRPGVAWSTLCLPRKFGGVGLVDIADQSLALHLVYLQRLLRPPSPTDFVSSWLVYAFQVYTGHQSVLPWFFCPALFKSRVSSVLVLKHLGKLLLRLPKLVPSSGWSARWFLDLPLCSVLSTVPSVRPPCDPSHLDPRFLVSDISFWQPDLGIVDGVTSHLAWSSRALRPVFLAVNRDRGPVSLVYPPVMDSKIVLSHADYFTMPHSDGATSWMPDCTHWTVSNSSRSAVPVARLSLGALRRYWHPAKDTITSRMGPPLRLPAHLLLSPASWRLFWSLVMPAKAFTPWWRLLHDRVSHRSWCHNAMPTKVLSPACALCGCPTEDLYHFVVGCHFKSSFWQDVVSLLSLQELLPSDPSIWLALTTFCNGSDLVVIDEDVLVVLGAAYSTLWKYHWRCVIDEEPWIASAAINMVRQDHGKLLLRLPKLVPSSGWSARWFLDLPLCSVLSTVPSVRPPCDPSHLDPRFLVSDISFWQPDLGIVDGVTSHLAWPSRVLRPVFLAVNRDRGPVSLVYPPVMDSKIVLSHADYFTMPHSDGATSWMPDCTHWTVLNSSRSAVPVARLSLGALRRYWHPAKDTITSRMGPPLRLPTHLLLSPASWRLFWSLVMPAKAFTPWWRLLHDRVSHRLWCHTAMSTKVLSPACALCGYPTEDLYHFVVGCHFKSSFWQDVVSWFSLQELLPSDLSIWLALTTFCNGSDLVVIDEDVLAVLGAAYSTLWKYHWRCVIDEEPWIASAAINMVRQDHGSFFSSLSLASVQAGTLTLPLTSL